MPTHPQVTPETIDLLRWRSLDALHVLRVLADFVKEDDSFKPTRSSSTRRIHATAAGADWEFLVNGAKYYDTRARKGGGGSIDLVMHVWRVPFRTATGLLRRAGA